MKTLEKVASLTKEAMLDSLKDIGTAPFGLDDVYETESIMSRLNNAYDKRTSEYKLSKKANLLGKRFR